MIFPLLYPCINYWATKHPPVSIEFWIKYPTVPQTLLIQGDNLSPCIIYRAFSDTGGSYCTNCALCIGSDFSPLHTSNLILGVSRCYLPWLSMNDGQYFLVGRNGWQPDQQSLREAVETDCSPWNLTITIHATPVSSDMSIYRDRALDIIQWLTFMSSEFY